MFLPIDLIRCSRSSHNGSYISYHGQPAVLRSRDRRSVTLGNPFACAPMIVTSPGDGFSFDFGMYCFTARRSLLACPGSVAPNRSRICWARTVCSTTRNCDIVRTNGLALRTVFLPVRDVTLLALFLHARTFMVNFIPLWWTEYQMVGEKNHPSLQPRHWEGTPYAL